MNTIPRVPNFPTQKAFFSLESEGFLFVATKRNLSGVPGGLPTHQVKFGCCLFRAAALCAGALTWAVSWAATPPRGEQPGAGCGTPGRLSLVLAKESPPDPERKAALGGLICRGLVLSWRFDVDTSVSLSFYETGVLSFSRNGALRRSAYVGN